MRDRPSLDLFVISWLLLFLELTCIRWLPSHVLYITFFTNIVLLASFVGMSVGLLTARAPTRHLLMTPVWLAVMVGVGFLFHQFRYTLQFHIAVGDQFGEEVVYFGTEATYSRDVPIRVPVEVVAAAVFVLIAGLHVGPGQEMGRCFNRVPGRLSAYAVNLVGSLAGIVTFSVCSYLQIPPVAWFAAVAVGLGYFLLRPQPAAEPAPDGTPVPPPPRLSQTMIVALLLFAVLGSVKTSGVLPGQSMDVTWSPYYRIDHVHKERIILANLLSHQAMDPRDQAANNPYALPYLFQRDVPEFDKDGKPKPDTRAWKPFKKILIIGAGSGNDVARAIQWCPGEDVHIDAVEIDPVIQRIGVDHHPDNPYADPRVHVTLNDGRNFLRSAPAESYDLVIFALIDSLVLHSGYANLRLESYLFTEESFQDVKRVLKPNGVYAVYNYFRLGWLAVRIQKQLAKVFETPPVVLTSPTLQTSDPRLENPAVPHDRIELDDTANAFTAFFSGKPEVIEPLRRAFQTNGNTYWFPWYSRIGPGSYARFGGPEPPKTLLNPPLTIQDRVGNDVEPYTGIKFKGGPPAPMWMRLRVAEIPDAPDLKTATDDWPFLYVRSPAIPLVTLRGIALMLLSSVLVWLLFRPARAVQWEGIAPPAPQQAAAGHVPGTPHDEPVVTAAGVAAATTGPEWGLMGRSFFLGAGFMLVETKAVVHMALLFGGTWMVNSVVFASILVMSLIGTLFVAGVRPRRLEPYYIGLFLALGLGLAIPMSSFLGLDRTTQVVLACALVFAPVAFAGVVFSTTFGRSAQPDRVMGANVAGALLGGLSENASVLLGFQYLLCVAVGFYLLSALCGNRTLPAGAAADGV